MASGTFGERLKRERELREVTPNEIVVATRISLRFLDALENEQWEKLPGGVFNRGFVRAIARYLGLDEEKLLAEYDLARGDQIPEVVTAPENRIPSPPKWVPALFLLGILLGIAALAAASVYGFRWYAAFRRAHPVSYIAAQSVDASSRAPALSADPPSSAADPAPLDLFISTSSATHLRIAGDGKLIFDGDMRAGDSRRFSAESSFEIAAGDSGAVLLELNGQTMPPVGAAGASGTIILTHKDLRLPARGNSQP